jgi:hypothetical protein
MRNIELGTERDLIWHWARAEIESGRFFQFYGSLEPHLREFVVSDDRSRLTPEDWGTLRKIVFGSRSPLLKGLARLGTIWHVGKLPFSELAELEIMDWPYFVPLSPSRRLEAFVRGLDRGQVPPHEERFAINYRNLRRQFSIERTHGYPVLVAERKQGPYIVVEGYSRLSVLTSKYIAGEVRDGEIPVVLGICANLTEWYLNDDPTSVRLYAPRHR